MKILLITDNHNPAGGGAENYFFTLKSELQQHSDVTVCSVGFGPQAKRDTDSIVLQEPSSTLARLYWRLCFHRQTYQALREIIQAINPDIIHLHNVKKYTISLLKAVSGYRVIQTVHDYSSICPTGWNLHRNLQPCATGLRRACWWQHKRGMNPLLYAGLLVAFFRMRKLLKKVTSHFIAPSALLADYLARNQFQPATHLEPFGHHNTSIQFHTMQAKHFLYVGQLGKHKGIEHLIDEFYLACQRDSTLVLKILGSGKQEKKLRQKVQRLHLDNNIFFIGWAPPEKFYEECTAVIFPSIGLEAFGLVLTEAMNYGRAIIGSNRGPTAALVDDQQTGLLYDPLKTGDLAEKIVQLANNSALAKTYGAAAFQKRCCLPHNTDITQKMLRIYREVIATA